MTPSELIPGDLVLNIAPVEIDDATIAVERFPYMNPEQLRGLRSSAWDTHVTRRSGDSVVCVPLRSNAPLLGGQPANVRLQDDLYLAATLLRESLIRYLHNLDRTILDYRPVKFLAGRNEDDYVGSALPHGTHNPGYLLVCPVFEVDIRVISPEDAPPFVAITLDVHASRRIRASCAELQAVGVDVHGVYVKLAAETRDPRLAQRLETVGYVVQVQGDVLTLGDHREGHPTVSAREAYPQSSYEFFDRCLTSLFPRHVESLRASIDQATATLRFGRSRFARLQQVRAHLSCQPLNLAQGAVARIGDFLASQVVNRRPFPRLHQAQSPVYVFDTAGSKTGDWPPDKGLSRYGPHSRRDFNPNRLRVCVLCQRSKQRQVEQFLAKFRDGIRGTSGNIRPFEKGFLGKYSLTGIDYTFFFVESPTVLGYQRAIREALSHGGPEGPNWNLCLVQIEQRFRDCSAEENPYMVSKAEFLTHQIPVQEFTIETTQIPDQRLQYALNNMALAVYAKMGGRPWLLKADPRLAQELVVGIGSARIGESRLGPGQRVVGITTVFTGDGNYYVSNLSRAATFETYSDELLSTLRQAVHQVRMDTRWQPRSPVRLVFHAFKPFRDAEIAAVKKTMEDLSEYKVEYAFINIIDDHPYILFDRGQVGIPDSRSRRQKGVWAPGRGLFLQLSDNELLLTLTGVKDVKRPEDGVPRPVLLRIHRESTFINPMYLARQVYAFSCHSWQGFFPCGMPVTIGYSSLIARQLGQLATLPSWKSDVLLGKIGWTRWFL